MTVGRTSCCLGTRSYSLPGAISPSASFLVSEKNSPPYFHFEFVPGRPQISLIVPQWRFGELGMNLESGSCGGDSSVRRNRTASHVLLFSA